MFILDKSSGSKKKHDDMNKSLDVPRASNSQVCYNNFTIYVTIICHRHKITVIWKMFSNMVTGQNCVMLPFFAKHYYITLMIQFEN